MTPELLKAAGLIRTSGKDVKILGQGELTKKLTVVAHDVSASAREKIEAAGGSVTLLREPKAQEEAEGAARTPEPAPKPARGRRRS